MTQTPAIRFLVPCLAITVACSTAEGEGQIESEQLTASECWSGAFQLNPDFFAANPYRDDQQLIRIQRGSRVQDVSDGITLVVTDVQGIRNGRLGTPIAMGLPEAIENSFVDSSYWEPNDVSLALYLNGSCHRQNIALYSVQGTITFKHLFSNDRTEDDASDRLIEASFDTMVGDPRDADRSGQFPEESLSHVTGWFRFFFERGVPSQPFP